MTDYARPDADLIRKWAERHGHKIAPTGRLPEMVIILYDMDMERKAKGAKRGDTDSV